MLLGPHKMKMSYHISVSDTLLNFGLFGFPILNFLDLVQSFPAF